MDPLAVALFMSIAAFIGIGRYVWAHRRWRNMMEAAGALLGMPVEQSWGGIGLDELRATRGEATVRLRAVRVWPLPRGDGGRRLMQRKGSDHLDLDVQLAHDPGVAFAPEPARVVRLVMGRDLESGDVGFDEAVRLTGNATALRSLLDHRTRDVIRAFVACGGRLEGRHLRLVWAHAYNVDRLVTSVEAALAVAGRLRPSGTARARLAAIARTDPLPAVRARVVDFMREAHAHAAETEAAALALLGDPDAAVRLAAARAAGDAGLGVLEALLAEAAASVQLGAVEALAASEVGRAVLMRRLAELSGAARAAAVAALRSDAARVGGLAVVGDAGGGLSVVESGGLSEG
ncbi:MAG: hypothetical protein H6703_12840 [Myxococcales bacterium]|nr:hypothetical protein [Myxococcales bacterium]